MIFQMTPKPQTEYRDEDLSDLYLRFLRTAQLSRLQREESQDGVLSSPNFGGIHPFGVSYSRTPESAAHMK